MRFGNFDIDLIRQGVDVIRRTAGVDLHRGFELRAAQKKFAQIGPVGHVQEAIDRRFTLRLAPKEKSEGEMTSSRVTIVVPSLLAKF